MSKMKKILMGMIISLIAIFGFGNTSFAKTYNYSSSLSLKVGMDVKIDYQDYNNSSKIFCMQHGRHLDSSGDIYEVVSKVSIEGNVSKDHKGKKITNKSNGIFAYILASDVSKDTKQRAVWMYKKTWMNNVGSKHAGLKDYSVENKSGVTTSHNTESKKLYDNAVKYAKNLGEATSEGIEDKTENKESVKATLYSKDDKAYLRIGPFNWTFSGKLSSIKVVDKNNKKVSALYSRYKGSNEEFIKVEDIQSGKNFYISVPANTALGIKVSAKGKIDNVKCVDIWFLKSKTYSWQNLIKVKSTIKSITIEDEFSYEVEGPGKLLIVKKAKNQDIKLPNVGFIIQNKETGKYLDKNKNLVSKSNAYEFKTDANGEILIEGLRKGTYIAYETSNPNEGYEIVTDGKSKKVEVDKTATLTVYNQYGKGSLKIIKVDKDNNSTRLQGVKFKVQNKDTGKYVALDENGKVIYVDSEEEAKEFETDANGEILIKDLNKGTYVLYETETKTGYELDTEGKEVVVEAGVEIVNNVQQSQITTIEVDNEYVFGNLKVIKVDEDNHEIRIPGVKFIIQNAEGKYVHKEENGDITYVTDKAQATEFETDGNGEIFVENLRKGKYVLYETETNKAYELNTEGQETEVIAKETKELEITNKRSVINLSGFVWKDVIYGKSSIRNDLYKDDEFDSGDILLEGITVRLVDKNGNTVKNKDGKECITKTDSEGKYLFEDILIAELEDYHVEFEYNGVTYTNVALNTSKDNGSKAEESETTRNNFNAQFAEVTGTENATRNAGYTRDVNGNKTHDLTYKIGEHEATLESISGGGAITAETSSTYVKDRYEELTKNGEVIEEITFINLGLYEREQPDIALIKDIQNVKLSINGYSHVYNYAQRFTNAGEYGDGFNVGVKFGEKYGNMSYSRAVYKADCNYVNENDKSRELKVDVTYRIAMKNESTSLVARVNSIVDYFDSNYTISKVGTQLDENGNVISDIAHNEGTYNSDYNKSVINTNATVNPQQNTSIYVQFALNREAVLKILNEGENLDNVAEVNSYSIFDGDGKLYAGIDKDSNPGNCVPGSTETYEDDTDKAPALQLELSDESIRKLSGTVFEDSAEETKLQAKIREGDGIYAGNEHGIENVKVVLKDSDGNIAQVYAQDEQGNRTWKDAVTTTDGNGNFEFEGFIPDRYTLEYTWGGQTYTDSNGNTTTYDVNNYKGTIYNESKHSGEMWWNSEVETRYSDAKDNWSLRQSIDNGTNTEGLMNSSTATMDFGIEEGDSKGKVTTTETIVDGDKFVTGTYEIINIDYGIIERPRQELDMGKRVSHIKITLANGQVLTDTDVNEDGTFVNPAKGLTYQQPTGGEEGYAYGSIWQQIDNELIQGSTLEVTYDITVKNDSEYDYANENFYQYGSSSEDKSNPVKITPTVVNDYLDEEFAYDESSNSDWTIVSESRSENNSQTTETITTPAGDWEQVGEPITTEDGSTVTKYKKHLGSTETTTQGVTGYKYTIQSKKRENLSGETILELKDAASKIGELEAGQASQPIKLTTSKVLANSDEITLENKAEITEIQTTNGRQPNMSSTLLYDEAETIIVTPNTGENQNYIIPIVLVMSVLAILGVGVVVIKKKVMTK